MPERVEACVRSVMDDNPDMDEDRAWAICKSQEQEGNLAEDADISTGCPDGQVNIGGECVPIETVDAPPSILSEPMHLTLKSLETEPIERIEDSDGNVRFTSIRLLGPGVWSDAGSQTATYYPPEGIENLTPEWDQSEYDGPPINIMHDLDMETFEAHEASIAGHIDPDTLDTDDEGNLYADLVFDTSSGAGQYADENLTSTLESEGTVGFGGPSVEIPAEGLQQSHDETRDMPRVDGGRLTGAGMVFDPASKNVNFAREAARRPVAMSASGAKGKVLTRQATGMREKFLNGAAEKLTLADAGEVREILDMFGLDTDDLDDEEVMDMAEDLHEDLMSELEGGEGEEGDGEGVEAEEDGDKPPEEEDEDDEEDAEMADDDMETVMERVQNLASRLEDVEDAVSQAMTADDVDAELEDAAGNKLADAETVKTLTEAKEDLEARIKELENQPAESKTLTDSRDFEPNYDPDTGASSGW